MAELNNRDRDRLERLRALRKGGMNPEFNLSQQLSIGDARAERAAEMLVNPPAELRAAVSKEASQEVSYRAVDTTEPEEDTEELAPHVKFPYIFIRKVLDDVDEYNQGRSGGSTRVEEYVFVPVTSSTSSDRLYVCSNTDDEGTIYGELFIKWRSDDSVSKFGPMSGLDFLTFKTSDSLGVQCIGPGQNASTKNVPVLTVNIRIHDKGYVRYATWPSDAEYVTVLE